MSLPQPVPPNWKDLGKSSSDLLNKDFPTSGALLEVKTKTASNVTFKVAGNQDSRTSVIFGDIEAKYTDNKKGLVFTQTWNTSNILRAQLELENQIAKGLKLDVTSSLDPVKGGKNTLFNAIYKQPGVHSRAVLDVFKGPTFTADTVIGRNGFLFGGEASYDVTQGRITRYAAALGFNATEYAVALHGLNNGQVFSASYYHRVSPDVEAGAKAIYDTKNTTNGVTLEVAAKAHFDPSAFVKAKINNVGLLSLGYTQTLRPGVKASFGLLLDTQRLNDTTGGSPHKVGASFTFDG
ncbi:hypothetical protein BS47DRAFT_543906 [Hydnum rufescens UP504]|uniref:Voltage-dependent ion-selective channel n=1 Tax=Hydnum rufescens UP504 TaxID=1448309 RepID=A0A9P6B3U3_9AGAM|nr:hypothetical protein BS47DRAFT_543906 [Hydnum rufescens UP504]